MDRNIYKYNVEINRIDLPTAPSKIDFDVELKMLLNYITSLPKEERRKELLKSEKVMYLEEYKIFNEKNNVSVFYLKFASLKYNQTREVLNKDTLESKGRLKEINDGDKEYNHIVIIKHDKIVKAAFEYNYYGMQTLSSIISYLNDMCFNYFKNKGLDRYYYLEAHNEVSKEFIEELNKMKSINSTTLVIESERLGNTDFGNLSGRNEIKEEVEITFKKAKKSTIPKDIIEQYYEKKNNNEGVKRIYVLGRNSTNKVKLDTKEMKQKETISVKTNSFGEVDSDEMYEGLKKYLMEE